MYIAAYESNIVILTAETLRAGRDFRKQKLMQLATQ
jgi:hypothetical protein